MSAVMTLADALGVTAYKDMVGEIERRDAEIRDLNDALSAANQTIAALRSMPFVAASEHDRVKQQRDEALANVDALTIRLLRLEDGRHNVMAERALRMLQRVMATLAKETGNPSEESVRNEARAFLAECGVVSPEHEAHRQAYEEWEARRG